MANKHVYSLYVAEFLIRKFVAELQRWSLGRKDALHMLMLLLV